MRVRGHLVNTMLTRRTYMPAIKQIGQLLAYQDMRMWLSFKCFERVFHSIESPFVLLY